MKKLSKDAFGGVSGRDYVPYVEDKPKKSGSGIILTLGIILAAVFAASTAYSGMKAGLTVAAGIPGAIIGSGLISLFVKPRTILGKNLLQLMSSGGESVASGMIFVLPAVILVGGKINFFEGVALGVGAVLLGVGVFTLVQDYMLVDEHGKLVYPEAMAISETLVASDTGGESLKYMGIGFGIGGIITVLTGSVLGIMNNVISFVNESFYKWKFETEVNPLLAGIGFIVGMDVSLLMFAGSILANFAIAPLLGYFMGMAGGGATIWDNASQLLNTADFAVISGSYVRYIGAGMMISGGLIGAIKLIPTIISSISATMKGRKTEGADAEGGGGILPLIIGAVVALVMGFVITGNIAMALVGGILSIILSLLFVIVAGRLTGTIGTSNLPVSGMTIASMVILTLVFVVMGWTSAENTQQLLLFGTFIVLAISVGGGYSQSQKVTFVMGGNFNEGRRYFVIANIVGVIIVTGMMVILTPQLQITGANPPFGLPQANLMATLTAGITSGSLPWHMIIAGIVMGIVLQLQGVSIMTFAIGFYLPISTTSIILVGALIRVFIEFMNKKESEEVGEERITLGISLSSGLIAGGSIIGLIGIILQVTGIVTPGSPTGFLGSNWAAGLLLVILVISIVLPLLKVKNVKANDK
ncbi:OPT/YSL family transporter [Candidatus Enterococcus ferrettii]|uniref:OPT family oligopeptide transporter n=1 Tax=Candidatus Enterococcus ferrettii TaxID=2815324 RepID=A0ABV0EUR0_9ENTE|nr:OPT/YSL family transporter [Enterococcus sp. 665A]MBO1339314.1 OPT/YSL family transporter [Enterococcus sp. 665A]